MSSTLRILVIRDDRLGDLIVSGILWVEEGYTWRAYYRASERQFRGSCGEKSIR